jgi:hypothetical protein
LVVANDALVDISATGGTGGRGIDMAAGADATLSTIEVI